MQLLRHTPRLERRLHPSVHVEEVTDKVTARGTVLSVGNPARRPRCAFLTFQVMVRLLPSLLCGAAPASPRSVRLSRDA